MGSDSPALFYHFDPARNLVQVARNVPAEVPQKSKDAVADAMRSIFYAERLSEGFKRITRPVEIAAEG